MLPEYEYIRTSFFTQMIKLKQLICGTLDILMYYCQTLIIYRSHKSKQIVLPKWHLTSISQIESGPKKLLLMTLLLSFEPQIILEASTESFLRLSELLFIVAFWQGIDGSVDPTAPIDDSTASIHGQIRVKSHPGRRRTAAVSTEARRS